MPTRRLPVHATSDWGNLTMLRSNARNRLRIFALLIALAGAPFAARAQVSYESPEGPVEVLGLRRWTLAMLRDSIRHYVPGQDLHDAACMVTLRDSLHFVEASVNRFIMTAPGTPQRTYLAVKVIEPQDAARVQWRPSPGHEFSSLLPEYANLALSITDSLGNVARQGILFWLQSSDTAWRALNMSQAPAPMRGDGTRLYGFLTAHTSERDRKVASQTLRANGLWINRFVAAAVLQNFATGDSSWLLLVRALRDPHEAVRDAALMSLSGLSPHSVDWSPVATDLRLLLGGTNLSASTTVMRLLVSTSVEPSLAAKLLRGNGEWLLDHLGLQSPMESEAAHQLLVRLNGGVDLGVKRAAWTAWVASL